MTSITLSPEVLATIAAPISTRTVKPANADLLAIADMIVNLDNEGILAATIAEMRSPKAAPKAARKPKAGKTVDPKVGTGANMRMTLRGIEMPTNRLASDAAKDRIRKFDRKTIVKAAKKANLAGMTMNTLTVADASDLYFTLKG